MDEERERSGGDRYNIDCIGCIGCIDCIDRIEWIEWIEWIDWIEGLLVLIDILLNAMLAEGWEGQKLDFVLGSLLGHSLFFEELLESGDLRV